MKTLGQRRTPALRGKRVGLVMGEKMFSRRLLLVALLAAAAAAPGFVIAMGQAQAVDQHVQYRSPGPVAEVSAGAHSPA